GELFDERQPAVAQSKQFRLILLIDRPEYLGLTVTQLHDAAVNDDFTGLEVGPKHLDVIAEQRVEVSAGGRLVGRQDAPPGNQPERCEEDQTEIAKRASIERAMLNSRVHNRDSFCGELNELTI